MLQIVRNNTPYNVLILFIFALLVKIPALLAPVAPAALERHDLYNMVVEALRWALHPGAFGFTLLAVVLLFLQALYLNGIAARHRLFNRSSYIPAFCYICFSSVYQEFNFFSPALLVNWCLLGALDVMFRFTQPAHPRKYIFNAGFLLSLAALIQFSAVFYFLLLVMALLLLRSFNLGEWAVAALGYLTPAYFYAGILFVADRFELFSQLPALGISLPRQMLHPWYLMGMLTGFVVLTGSGLFVLQGQMPKSTIYVRRSWSVVVICWIISILVAVLTEFRLKAAWLVVLPAMSLIISQALNLEKSRRFSNFIFYFSLALVIYSLFTASK